MVLLEQLVCRGLRRTTDQCKENSSLGLQGSATWALAAGLIDRVEGVGFDEAFASFTTAFVLPTFFLVIRQCHNFADATERASLAFPFR